MLPSKMVCGADLEGENVEQMSRLRLIAVADEEATKTTKSVPK